MGKLIEADFSRGPKRPPDDPRRRFLSGVTELVVEPPEPIDEAVDAFKALKLFKKEILSLDGTSEEITDELLALAADHRQKIHALSPEARDRAINIANQELSQEFVERQQPPDSSSLSS